MAGNASIQSRKREHVETVITGNANFRKATNGFENFFFENCSLPEVDWEEIDVSQTFLGRKLGAPFMITGMTGGYPEAENINGDLAAAADAEGVAFGLGSMRAMIEKPELKPTYAVRGRAPNVLLFGNIGGIQLKRLKMERLKQALREVGADMLAIHLNPSQEAVQAGGDVDWKGVLDAIRQACAEVGMPVIAKEVGAGISAPVAKKLEAAGVKAIDIAGAGGTSWVGVEVLRGGKREGNDFWDWGIPTATALQEVSKAVKIPVIASGGMRTGLEAAKAIRLGATLAGGAAPFIKAQKQGGEKSVRDKIVEWRNQLKIAMLCTGSRNLTELRKARLLEKS